ncbi:hypothetical protein BJ138DRAFT_1230325 [Hygrophoropsis aurantiaca]|uniref:Uncharacterized protein n=1 Tax=Hygrophoropsis aurantiaca TaxID=72124 RepID=A0ACB7ZX59_9AGAM|nr:hypothetical protein BJ138DRAFT_1230325 [Hygrophoropsis aurantiaca]
MTQKIHGQSQAPPSNPPPDYPSALPVTHTPALDTHPGNTFHAYCDRDAYAPMQDLDFQPSLQLGGGRRYISPPVEVTPTRLRTRIKATERDVGIVRDAEGRRARLVDKETSEPLSGEDVVPFYEENSMGYLPMDNQSSGSVQGLIRGQSHPPSDIQYEHQSSPFSVHYDTDILDQFLEASSDFDTGVQDFTSSGTHGLLRASSPVTTSRYLRPTSEVPADTRISSTLNVCPPRRASSCDPINHVTYPHSQGSFHPPRDLSSVTASQDECHGSSSDERSTHDNLPTGSAYQSFRIPAHHNHPVPSTSSSSASEPSPNQLVPHPKVPGFFLRNKNSQLAALPPNKKLAPPSTLTALGFEEPESMDRDTLIKKYPNITKLPAMRLIPPTPAKSNELQPEHSNDAALEVANELFPEEENTLSADKDMLPAVGGRRSNETNELLEQTFQEINAIINGLGSKTKISTSQILDLWMKQYNGRTIGTNYWNKYNKRWNFFEEEELARIPVEDRPQGSQKVTPKIRGLCFEQYKLKYTNWQERLDAFEELSLCDEAPQTVQQRASEFAKIFKKVSSLLEFAETRFGFMGLLLMCGSVVNQDASLGKLYTSQGLQDFFPVRFLVNTDEVLGHAKAHVYNHISLKVAQESAAQRDENMNSKANISQMQPTNYRGSPEKRSTGLGEGPSEDPFVGMGSPEKLPTNIVPVENVQAILKATLREEIEKLGGIFPSDRLFPWVGLLGVLSKACLMAIGWPEGCPLPGERDGPVSSRNTKGVSGITNANRYSLLGALDHKILKFVKVPKNQWEDLLSSIIPVIQGVAPNYDSPHARGRQMFHDGHFNREGLPRLPRSTAATKVKPSGSRKKINSTADMEVLNLISDDESESEAPKIVARKNLKKLPKIEVVIPPPPRFIKNLKGKGREVIKIDQSSEVQSGSEYQADKLDEEVNSDYEAGETAQKRKAKSAGNLHAAKKRISRTDANRDADHQGQTKGKGKALDEPRTKLSVKQAGKQKRVCSPVYIESDSDDQLLGQSGITTEGSARPKPKPLVPGSAVAIKRENEIKDVLAFGGQVPSRSHHASTGAPQPSEQAQERSHHTSTGAPSSAEGVLTSGQFILSTRQLSRTLSPSPAQSTPSPKRTTNSTTLSLNHPPPQAHMERARSTDRGDGYTHAQTLNNVLGSQSHPDTQAPSRQHSQQPRQTAHAQQEGQRGRSAHTQPGLWVQETRMHQEVHDASTCDGRNQQQAAQNIRRTHSQQGSRDVRVQQTSTRDAQTQLGSHDIRAPQDARDERAQLELRTQQENRTQGLRMQRGLRTQQDTWNQQEAPTCQSPLAQQEAQAQQDAHNLRAQREARAQALAEARALIKAHEDEEVRVVADSRISRPPAVTSQFMHGFQSTPSNVFSSEAPTSMHTDRNFNNMSRQLLGTGYTQIDADIYSGPSADVYTNSFQPVDQYNPSYYHTTSGAGSSQPETLYAPPVAPPPYIPGSTGQSDGRM